MPEFNIYGLLIGVGIVVGLEVAKKVARMRGVDKERLERSFWWIIIGGIVGARAYHVIDLWEYYSVNWQEIFYIWNGGLGIWGAIVGGVLGMIAFVVKNPTSKVGSLSLLDIIIVGVPLAQAIGRWGNYFNNELWGKNGEPIFFYESVLNLVLFGILWKLAGRENLTVRGSHPGTSEDRFSESDPRRGGTLSGIYLVGYGLIRGSLEQFRTEEAVWRIGDWNVSWLFCLTSILIGLTLIFLPRSASQKRF